MKIYNQYNLPKHVVKHSPAGFAWGYGGSGPSDLARCLLLEVIGIDRGKYWSYQDFKIDFVSKWNDNWQITENEIKEWVNKKTIIDKLNLF
jgi:hypothetical protein